MNEKNREDLVSMVLGLVVVAVIVGMIFNFFQKRRGSVSLNGVVSTGTQSPSLPTPTPLLSPESENEYVVVDGDNLWKIAVKKYNNGYMWTKIAKENGLGKPGQLVVGQKLKLSKVETVKVMENIPSQLVDDNQNYKVVRGDSLWKIAVKVYGDGYKWSQIWNLNKKNLKDPNKLEVGMILTMLRADK